MAGEIQIDSVTALTASGSNIVLNNVDTATNRTNLGLGSIATQAADSVSISGGNITGGTIGSGVVFPAGHIVQSVMNPTISNYDSTAGTSVKFGDLIGQITITSGNGVLIFASLPIQCVPSSNGLYIVGIYEGTIASTGSLLAHNYHFNGNTSLTTQIVHTMWAYDSSPASTTPSYTFKADRASGGTTSVDCPYDPSTSPGNTMFYSFLFEIKQ